jgi:hypothetical protein
MADKSIFWNGKKFLLPQAASRIDSSALARSPLGGGAAVAILGEMQGLLAPKVPHLIGSPSTALALLHPNSAEARLASQLVFDPSPGSGTPGASEVYLVPVNPSTRATLTLSNVLKLDSYLYGLPANQVKVKVAAGTTGKKVSVGYGTGEEEFDNLTRESFSIVYIGAGSACTMDIDISAATHLLSTDCTDAAADNLALDLSAYDTIQELVDAINATGVYTAVVFTDSPNELSMQLDAVTTQDIKTAAYTAKSDLQAIVDGLAGSGYVEATRIADAGTVPANTADWTYLSGGTNGVTTSDDWLQALDALKVVDVQILLPITSDASVHSAVDSHLDEMSGVTGKLERRAFVGGDLQTWAAEANRTASIAALKAAIKLLNSDRLVHACLGSKHYDPNGRTKLYPAYITAAMYAGIAAGGFPVQPLTRKYLRCLGLEVELRPEEIDTLINANAAPPIVDMVNGAGWVISRQVTTWGKDVDLYRIEFSVGQGADYIARQVRQRHEQLIGLPGTAQLDVTIVSLTNSVLEQAKREGIIRDYDPTKTALRVEGTVRYVDYSAEPILPVNFIFSTYKLLPTSFTIGL